MNPYTIIIQKPVTLFIFLLLICFCWQVRLENKIIIHSGIVCLNPKVITVLGGIVQSLHEEWEMNRKYSGISRDQQNNTNGPPPFEKLQIEAPSKNQFAQPCRSSCQCSKAFCCVFLFFFLIYFHAKLNQTEPSFWWLQCSLCLEALK